MIKVTDKILDSIDFVSHLHRNHFRRDELSIPYVSHLFSVAMLLGSVTDDEDIIIAGLLHDALEDIEDYKVENLKKDFGERIANLVIDVTEDETLEYKERKLKYINNLKSANIDSLIISIADKYHNAYSFCKMKKEFQHIGHKIVYTEILNIAKERIETDHKYYPLVIKLEKVLNSL